MLTFGFTINPATAADGVKDYDVYSVTTDKTNGQPVLTAFNPGLKFVKVTGSNSYSGTAYGLTADGKIYNNQRQEVTTIASGAKIIDISLDSALANDGRIVSLINSAYGTVQMPADSVKMAGNYGITFATITSDGDIYVTDGRDSSTVKKAYDHNTSGPAQDIALSGTGFLATINGGIYYVSSESATTVKLDYPSGITFGNWFSDDYLRNGTQLPDTAGRIWAINGASQPVTVDSSGYADPNKQSAGRGYFIDADGFLRTSANNRKVVGRTFEGIEATENGAYVYEDPTYNHHDQGKVIGSIPQSGDPAASVRQSILILLGGVAIAMGAVVLNRNVRLSRRI